MFYTQLILRGKGESVKDKKTEGGDKAGNIQLIFASPLISKLAVD